LSVIDDFPGVAAESIDVEVDRDVLTVRAERLEASYEAGVLTAAIPVVEQARPRKVEVHVGATVDVVAGPVTDASSDEGDVSQN
jgi:HSP20 family protein